MAKATKMAVKSSAKSAKSTSSSVSKGSLGTIGDLRSKYRQDLNNDVTIKGLFSSHFSLLVNHKHMFTCVNNVYEFPECSLQNYQTLKRSGTSSGFSSGSTDPSDSDGSSGISSSRYQNPYKSSGMQINSIPVQYWLPKYPKAVRLCKRVVYPFRIVEI